MTGGVTDLTTRVLEAALDGASAQHRVAANNLANVETPGYSAQRVRFEEQLRAALRAELAGASHGAIEGARPSIATTTDPAGPDGNNVSVEWEMTELGEAGLRYQMLTRMLDRRLQMIGTAIGDGRNG
ncbi:MAG: flagellar basal body rod protein FlgB [Armatimonadota bacterium]